jgi:hypothetical protein
LFANEGSRYDDDIGADQFTYVGEDPQGPSVDNPGREDQELKRGNAALREAIDTPLPIFLFFQSSDNEAWEFRGMVDVMSFEYKPQNDRYIYEFTLEPIDVPTESVSQSEDIIEINNDETVPDISPPPRSDTKKNRIIRNTRVVQELKDLYNCRCQVCDERRQRSTGGYAEGHHLRPLGSPHHGPDNKENLLILCPDHHADFDHGMLMIDSHSYEISHAYEDELDGTKLSISQEHQVNPRFIRYHNEGLVQFSK